MNEICLISLEHISNFIKFILYRYCCPSAVQFSDGIEQWMTSCVNVKNGRLEVLIFLPNLLN